MARNAAAAVAEFTAEFQRVLSCVSLEVIQTIRPAERSDHEYTLFAGDQFSGFGLTKRSGTELRLRVRHFYSVSRDASRRDFTARSEGYMYSLLDSSRQEIIAFHHHPKRQINEPHLHVRSSLLPELARAHVPSGSVPIAALVRMLIDDLGVEPLRDDWREILAAAGSTQ